MVDFLVTLALAVVVGVTTYFLGYEYGQRNMCEEIGGEFSSEGKCLKKVPREEIKIPFQQQEKQ